MPIKVTIEHADGKTETEKVQCAFGHASKDAPHGMEPGIQQADFVNCNPEARTFVRLYRVGKFRVFSAPRGGRLILEARD